MSKPTVEQRLIAKTVKQPDGCWMWTGLTMPNGYGSISVGPRGNKKQWLAHRLAYTLFIGTIPDGLHIDHLCSNRACVNPAHLEAVTPKENLRRGNGFGGRNARKTHCKWGHPYDEENTHISPTGKRVCRACHRIGVNISTKIKRAVNEEFRQNIAAKSAIYRQNNKEKALARDRFFKAVKAGKLIRPDECEDCGASGKVHGHHTDYAKPLEVEWLCRRCHGKRHRTVQSIGASIREEMRMSA